MDNEKTKEHGPHGPQASGANEALLEQSWSTRLGVFADKWWPLFVIAFGAVFILGIPTQ